MTCPKSHSNSVAWPELKLRATCLQGSCSLPRPTVQRVGQASLIREADGYANTLFRALGSEQGGLECGGIHLGLERWVGLGEVQVRLGKDTWGGRGNDLSKGVAVGEHRLMSIAIIIII